MLPGSVAGYLLVGLNIYLIVALGLLVVKAVAAIVDSLDALSKKYSSPDNWLRHYEKLSNLIPLLRRCLEYVIYVAVATLVVLQLNLIQHFAAFGPQLTKVIGIFFISRVIVEIGNLLIDRSQTRAAASYREGAQTAPDPRAADQKRHEKRGLLCGIIAGARRRQSESGAIAGRRRNPGHRGWPRGPAADQ